MVTKEKELLSEIYQRYLSTGQREFNITFSDFQDKSNTYSILDHLRDDGFIEYIAVSMGFCDFRLTTYGIQFAENGFQYSRDTRTVSGNNNIVITGTSNTVSGNYNKISVDIGNSDLPEDCKELIQSFLYEMQDPHLNPEKKIDKIKSFLADISSGTISGVASSGLSALLFHLLSQM